MSSNYVPNEEEQKTGGLMVELYEWLEAIAFALSIVVILFTFVFRVVSVSGPSMNPTLISGDRVILNSLFFTPSNGDIVVITQPNSHDNEPLIKRVIAVEGQTIALDPENDTVTVDGVVLNENYILEEDLKSAGNAYEYPLTVPKGKVFVMGDNRNDSFDSRADGLGMVDEDYIMGRAIFRIYPFERVGGLD
ncbi:MAG: signal peptidase I [Clostridia bacterium]|nr:signal peptidase I [Clostridia bacterium]